MSRTTTASQDRKKTGRDEYVYDFAVDWPQEIVSLPYDVARFETKGLTPLFPRIELREVPHD